MGRSPKNLITSNSVRLAITVADQLTSSLGNFMLVFALARTASPEDFGAYALGVAVLNFGLNLNRSIIATPFTIDTVEPGQDSTLPPPSVARSSALALLLGSILAVVVGIADGITALSASYVALVLSVLTISLPLLMFQDFLRYVAVARRRPIFALLSDASWTLIVAVLFVYQIAAATPASAVVCALVWLAGLAMAAVVLLAAGMGQRPRTRGLLPWLRGDPRHTQLLGDALLVGGGPILLLSVVSLLCGTISTAALRGASTVFGPLNTLMLATSLALVPEVRRQRSPRGERLLAVATLGVCGGAAAFGLFMTFFVPEHIGQFLLGETWPLTHRVLLATTVEYVGFGMLYSSVVWCRAKNRVDMALRVQVVQWVLLVVTALGTGLLFGNARGVAWGFAVVGVVTGVMGLVRARRLAYV